MTLASSTPPTAPPKVALFVTCLVNQFRPSVGFAAISLLEQASCDVIVPKTQTCCGQPGYNNGLRNAARETAKSTIKLLEPYDYVVLPSGSCTGMLSKHYPQLLSDDIAWKKRADSLSNKTWELCQFLVERLDAKLPSHSHLEGKTISYQDSCSCKRELKNTTAPRQLIKQLCVGSSLVELNDPESCCGFGGTFSVKYPDISERLVSDKIQDIKSTGADIVVSADLGCLMNIAGYAARTEIPPIEVRHIAEILANNLDAPSMTSCTQNNSSTKW
ncbi:MAG: (Fe-S)-binding protein [Pseudomonadales bacterium]|nr:(Fe-S)-binding protein [Pseudomonadales bacterium]